MDKASSPVQFVQVRDVCEVFDIPYTDKLLEGFLTYALRKTTDARESLMPWGKHRNKPLDAVPDKYCIGLALWHKSKSQLNNKTDFWCQIHVKALRAAKYKNFTLPVYLVVEYLNTLKDTPRLWKIFELPYSEVLDVPFGQYEGESLNQVFAEDPGYLEWACKEQVFNDTAPEFAARVRQILKTRRLFFFQTNDDGSVSVKQ